MIMRKIFYRFTICVVKCVFKVLYRLKVYGTQHYLPGSALIAPNHVSFLDPPAIAVACPGDIHFLARSSLFKSWFGRMISALNAHPIQHNAANLKVMKQINHLLKEGRKVLLFPEGARAKENSLQKIQPGIALLLAKSETAIIPTYIHGTYDIWNRYRKFPKLFGKTAVVFGSPICWEDYADMDRKEAQEVIHQRLGQAIEELRKWYESGAQGIPP